MVLIINCIGLHLIIAVKQDEYVATDVAGVRVIITSQGEMPFPEDSGIVAKPGQMTSIGFRKVNNV